MTRYTSGNKLNLKLGVESFSEDLLTLEVIGNTNIEGDINVSSGNSITAPTFYGDGSNLTNITAGQVGALSGVSLREEGSLVGSVGDLNFVSGNLTATASGIGGTITLTDNPTFATITGDLTGNADTATTLESDSSVNTTGIITAASFSGSGSDLTNITAGQVGALSGVSLREEGSLVGSVGDLNFVSGNLTATASGIGGTITLTDNPTFATITGDLTGNADTATTLESDSSVNTTGIITAASFSGSGSDLTNITAGQVGAMADLESDTDPDLGGDLDLNGFDIVGTGNVNITGVITATSFSGNGSGLTGITAGQVGAMADLESDTDPDLGGDLDLNGFDITGTGNVNITGVITATSFTGDLTGNADTATTLESDSSVNTTGIITAASFSGSGSDLTNITAGQVGALSGVTIREEGTLVGSSGAVGDINFVGNYITATASGIGATITLSDITLGTDTIGDYVASISGTANEISVTGGTGEGSTPQIGLPDNVTIGNNLSVSGDLNVEGTLTYEDITNVDSIGIITARHGIDSQGDINVSAGNSVTAPNFYGDGSGLTGITAGQVGAMADLESDTDPDLGGDLDLNGFDIVGTGNVNITGVITATSFDGSLATSNLSGTITNTQLEGSIANGKLANSSVSYGGVQLSLGGSDATPAFDLSDATNYPYSSLVGAPTIPGDTSDLTNGAGFITDITTQTDPKYLRSNDNDTASGNINFTSTTTPITTNAVKFNNTENDGNYYTDATGVLAFDENFYSDTQYGTGTYDPSTVFASNGGGILIKNEDGWGAVFTSQNSRFATAEWDGLTVDGNRVLTVADEGSGNGLDADTLDGVEASDFVTNTALAGFATSYLRSDATDQYDGQTSGRVMRFRCVDSRNAANTGGSLFPLEIYQNVNTSNSDAAMTFHISGRYATYFGLNRETNDLFVGGWSKGAAKYKIWHAGNDGSGSGLDADLLDGQEGSYYLNYNNFTNIPTIPTNNNQLTNGAGYLTSFDITTQTDPKYLRSNASDTTSGNLTVEGVIFTNEIRDRTGSQLVLNAGEAEGKFSGQTGEYVYVNAESGLYVSTPDRSHPNFQSGYTQDSTIIRGEAITVNGNTVWHAGNDGSGSGLDADTLDGIQADRIPYGSNTFGTTGATNPGQNLRSGFFDVYGTANGAPTNTWYSYINIRHTNTSAGWGHQIAGSFYNNGDLYNRHYDNSNYAGWTKIWNAANDGSGSGLDADTLDGAQPSVSASNSTIVQRHSSGYIFANYFNTTPNDVTSGVTKVCVETGNDGYIRHGTSAAIRSFINVENGATADQTAAEILTAIKTVDGAGSGLDADLLDGQEGSYYLDYTNFTGTPTIPTNNNQLTNGAGYITSFDITTQTDPKYLRSNAADTFSGDLTSSGSARILLKKTDNNVSDHIQFYNGTTRIGEIGCQDTTWLRINQVTAKNIYTPRYIRADGGFFVDGTTYGISGTGVLLSNTGATIGGNTAWHAGNDGAGSGLDADLLDGQQGSYYQNASNLNAGTIPDARITDIGDSQARIITFDNLEKSNLSADGQLGFDASQGLILYRTQQGTSGATTTVLDGWNVAAGTNISITNLGSGDTGTGEFTFSVTQGSGSGLDADTLDGQQGSYYLDYDNFSNTPTIPTNNNQLTNGAGYITDITTQTDPKYLRSNANDVYTGTLTGAGNISFSGGNIEIGNGSGSVAMTINDGYGNANLAFNHAFGVPDVNGNALRIETNVDSTSNATIIFEGKSNVSANTAVGLNQLFAMTESGATCLGNTVWHAGNDGSGSGLDADTLDGENLVDNAATANTVAGRNGSGDIFARLIRQTFGNQSTISGGLVFRVNNSTDNYLRVCSNTSAIRTFLNVPTRTGGDASGTWGINVTGNAATADEVSITTDTNNNTTYVAFVANLTDTHLPLKRNSSLTYNAGTGRLNATKFGGDGSTLTNLNASNISSGTISDARLPNSISSDITGNAATVSVTSITSGATERPVYFNDGTTTSGNGVLRMDGSANGMRYRADQNRLLLSNLTVANAVTGDLNGNASTATLANNVNISSITSGTAERRVYFNDGSTSSGSNVVRMDGSANGMRYRADQNRLLLSNLTVNNAVVGDLNGTATNATNVNLRSRNNSTGTHYITFGTAATGNQRLNTDTGLTYSSDTNTVTASTFSGNLSGNAATASHWISPITLTLAGDVTGSGTFDGQTDITFTATVNNDSHTHDTRYVRLTTNQNIAGTKTFTDAIKLNDNKRINFGTSSSISIRRDTTNLIMDIPNGGTFFIRDTSGTASIKHSFSSNGNYNSNGVISGNGSGITNVAAASVQVNNSTDQTVYALFANNNTAGQKTPLMTSLISANLNNGRINSGSLKATDLIGTGTRDIYANSNGVLVISSSDERLKTNINPITTQYDIIKQLNPVTFNWIDTENLGSQEEVGFIAQQMQTHVPQVIGTNNDGTLTIDYAKLTSVLTKALQESIAKIESLEARLDAAGL